MDRRVDRLIAMMKDSLNQRLSEKIMARSVNLSPARLRQLFKKETGRSPVQYLRCLRTKTAAFLLQTSFLSIKEVAFHTGSGDVSHFVRDFKKQYGVTPTEFRARGNRLPQSSAHERKISE
jgi:transcriptional regulator GlxA family with amidase domain